MNENISSPSADNAFASFAAERAAAVPTGAPSPRAIDLLRRTRPWAMFLAILGFIGSGFLAIATIIMVIGGLVGSSFAGSEGAAMVLGMAVMYAVLTALYMVISVALFRYARSIGALVQSGRAEELEDALDAQRGFWKLMGIVAIVSMALMTLAVIGVMVAAIAAGASAFGA
jgi:hypothetical protein